MAEHRAMDITSHKQTYEGFMKTTKVVSILIAITLVLMAAFLT